MGKLTKNYILNVLNQFITFIVPLVLVPYTSRVLGVDNIGIFSYCFSIVTIFATVGKMGLNTYGQLQIAKNQESKADINTILKSLVVLRFVVMLIVAIVYVGFVFVFKEYQAVLLLLLGYIFAEMLDISWFYQGLEEFKYIVLRNVITKLANIALVFAFVKSEQDFYKYVIVFQLVVVISNGSLWFGLKNRLGNSKGHIRNLKMHFIACLSYFIPTVANLIYNILDKTMLGYLGKSTYESGCYEQAYKLISVCQSCLLALGMTTLPRLTYLFHEEKQDEANKIIETSITVLNLLVFPMSVGLFLLADKVILLFLGEGYDGAIAILRILSVLMIFAVYNYTLGTQVYIARGEQKKYNITVTIAALTNAFLNILLIPGYKAMGAAIASLAAEIIIFIVYISWSGTIDVKGIMARSVKKYSVAALSMGFVVYLMGKVSMNIWGQLFLQVSVGVLTYFVFLIIFRDELLSNVLHKIRNRLLKK